MLSTEDSLILTLLSAGDSLIPALHLLKSFDTNPASTEDSLILTLLSTGDIHPGIY